MKEVLRGMEWVDRKIEILGMNHIRHVTEIWGEGVIEMQSRRICLTNSMQLDCKCLIRLAVFNLNDVNKYWIHLLQSLTCL